MADDCKVCAYAEEWLRAQHTPEWYIGNATSAEWDAAYAAANEKFAPTGEVNERPE